MKNLSNQKVPTVRPMILNSPKHRCNQSHGFSEGCLLTSNGPF